ncbi:unnamed protein product [Kuraishia capsulata CBS 1993]|uniref:DNA/RNA-binding protein Alba-like domain-containing protein n=1 Tax=Kuraishia capsulata CBS 1993 TaxID=1382522 RepID=W6MPC8_9ASCO|nr:uncharacterized protein KUCA_T00004507001 [Kuraishia capsulata CBS 1993]CDK28524.1 unnamed protein product [Kuraishia capsulata CBS 1993]
MSSQIQNASSSLEHLQPPKKKARLGNVKPNQDVLSTPLIRHEGPIEIKKHTKIQGKISSVLNVLVEDGRENNGFEEVKLMAISESVQKLLTVVEIVKQKVEYISNKQRKKKNTTAASTESQRVIVIGNQGAIGADRIRYDSFHQYNRLEFFEVKKQPRPTKRQRKKHTKPDGTDYDLEEWGELLIDTTIKKPILYIMLRFFNSKEPIDKDETLISEGWTFQE